MAAEEILAGGEDSHDEGDSTQTATATVIKKSFNAENNKIGSNDNEPVVTKGTRLCASSSSS